MARALRTLWQSLVTPVLTTSLYFIVFGGAIQMAGTVKSRKSRRHATSDWMEVEKQRGALKRQAAKARRYRRLREELRRWEKVQFAARYRLLGEAIDAARTKLADARAREIAASAHVAECTVARTR